MKESIAGTAFGFFSKMEPQAFAVSSEIKASTNDGAESELMLVEKNSVDGRLINIYTDNIGRVKAEITETDGTTTPAFFVKGLNAEIDVSNKELIQWLKNTLEQNCYFKISAGDVHVNLQLNGGMPPGQESKIALGLFSAAQGLVGLVIAPVSPIAGGMLIGSAWKTGTYLYNTPASQVNLTDYSKAEFIGGMGGAAGGFVANLLGPVGFLQEVGTGAIKGAAKHVTETAMKKVAYTDQPLDLSYSRFMQDVGSGAASSAAMNVGSKVYSSFTSGGLGKATESVKTVKATGDWKSSAASGTNKRAISSLFESDASPAKRIKLAPSLREFQGSSAHRSVSSRYS